MPFTAHIPINRPFEHFRHFVADGEEDEAVGTRSFGDFGCTFVDETVLLEEECVIEGEAEECEFVPFFGGVDIAYTADGSVYGGQL
mmetsp:Transcript_13546/g.29447  ORF Transcript_13546/g.29447 Transcript_13546/m.29447 type:complete len:86 (-) Transcript_13546:461-718(-)